MATNATEYFKFYMPSFFLNLIHRFFVVVVDYFVIHKKKQIDLRF